MTEQPVERSRLTFGAELQELSKRRDANAACAAEMCLQGQWDLAASFARRYRDDGNKIAEMLGLQPHD